MGELCPGAVQKPAAVLLPLDLFPCPRPSSLEPIALPHPNFQTTKTCRGRVSGLCPRRRAGAGGRAPAEISWSFESTSEPQPIALPSTTLPRKARAGGGSCVPAPCRSWRPCSCRLFPCPRPSSLEPIALPHPNFQTTKTCRGRVSGLCPRRRAGAGGRAPAEISWSFESTSEPQPIALPSTTLPRKARAGGGAVSRRRAEAGGRAPAARPVSLSPIEPGAHRLASPELPDHEDLSRTGKWAVPPAPCWGRGPAPAEISWSFGPPPSPSPSPCPQPPFLERRARGGSCAPPPARPRAGRINCAAGRNSRPRWWCRFCR